MALFACKRDTPRGILHWKYCSWKAKEGYLIPGRKNVKTDASTWQRIENVHEPIIDKDTF